MSEPEKHASEQPTDDHLKACECGKLINEGFRMCFECAAKSMPIIEDDEDNNST